MLQLPRTPQLRRRQLSRTLNATDPTATIIVPAETMFVFNGSSADLVQQFYQRYEAGDSPSKLDIAHNRLPARVRARLAVYDLNFKHLHPLLQRALLWDTGYVFEGGKTLTRVWTLNGTSMATIALSYDRFAATNCSAVACASAATNAANTSAYRSSGTCASTQLLPALRCAIESSKSSSTSSSDDSSAAFWATGGDAKAVPALTLRRHAWTDVAASSTSSPQNVTLFAIHSTSPATEATVDQCAASATVSLIIPCAVYTSDNAASTNWAAPVEGALVSVWLQHAQAEKPGMSLYITILIIAAAVVALVLLVVIGCLLKKRFQRRRQQRDVAKMTSADPAALLERSHISQISQISQRSDHAIVRSSNVALLESDGDASQRTSDNDTSDANASDALWTSVCGANRAVARRRVALDQLVFKQRIASSANSEIYSAKYHGARVAVKRVLLGAASDPSETLAIELDALATLRHRNLVRFYGVAIDASARVVCVVTEYARNGSLAALVSGTTQQRRALPVAVTWRQLEHVLLGVASALAYLHARTVPVVHGDVNASNVLLSSHWEAKVIGVKSNRENQTPPDDVRALGVLVQQVVAFANRIAAAATTHSIDGDEEEKRQIDDDEEKRESVCPQALVEIARQCLAEDPTARPRASDVVRVLQTLATSLTEVEDEDDDEVEIEVEDGQQKDDENV